MGPIKIFAVIHRVTSTGNNSLSLSLTDKEIYENLRTIGN